MDDIFSKITALILAVILLYIFPVESMLTRQDEITKVFVLNETAKFVDSARNLGYITPLMYTQFLRVLSSTGNEYEILMEHRHISIDPIYIDPVDKTSFQYDFNINENAYYTEEILACLFPPAAAPDQDRYYYMSKGDYFSVHVYNKNKTAAAKVQQMLIMAELPVKRIVVNYGGMVRDEAD
ncbi:MAG: hypothetical protein GX494_08015 [Clostridiaceae bacterium]|nr:hypothetical protein [Clostridiaceae bacterium]